MAVHNMTGHAQLSKPQDAIDTFWNGFISKNPGVIRNILAPHELDGDQGIESEAAETTDDGSYESVRKACVREVASIVRECVQRNEMFTDSSFNIWADIGNREENHDCLYSLPIPANPAKKSDFDDGWGAQTYPAQQARQAQKIPSQVQRSQESGGVPSTGKSFAGYVPGSERRVREIFDTPSFAPHAPGRHIPPLDATPNISYLGFAASLFATSTKSWAQIASALGCLLVLSCCLHCGGLAPSISGLVLLVAGCILTYKIRPRAEVPEFASCHIKQSPVLGNCWWLSSVAALCGRNDLLRKICVAWDEKHGVYGFLFYRDGAWIHTVVDDRLYLKSVEYHDSEAAALTGGQSSEKARMYQTAYQKGADSLFFGQSGTSNFTWLPLLEKAYAKVHGDYESLGGGNCAEGLEDLTGGVGDFAWTSNIEDQNRIWDSLRAMNHDHVYAISSPNRGKPEQCDGVTVNHAFAIEKALDFCFEGWLPRKVRLLKIRNPWGSKKGLWQGDWGIGSSKWGPLSTWWLLSQGHEDGVFYMTFEDAMKTFDVLYSLRLFDESKWTCRQQWVSMHATWIPQYNPIYFEISLQESSEVSIAFSQLDMRYFSTLQGRYVFHLEFLVKEKGAAIGDFVAKSKPPVLDEVKTVRSASIETHLQPGIYEVWAKITALERKDADNAVWSAEDVVKQSLGRSRKLQQTAFNYNTAYGKLNNMDESTSVRSRRRSTSHGRPTVHSSPHEVAWNAVCGVGLRVFSKDPDMQLEVRNRDKVNLFEKDENWHAWGDDKETNADDGDGWGNSKRTTTSHSRRSSIGGWIHECEEAIASQRADSVMDDANVGDRIPKEDAPGYNAAERVKDTIRTPVASSRRGSHHDSRPSYEGVELPYEQEVYATTEIEDQGPDDVGDDVNEAGAAEHFYQNGS